MPYNPLTTKTYPKFPNEVCCSGKVFIPPFKRFLMATPTYNDPKDPNFPAVILPGSSQALRVIWKSTQGGWDIRPLYRPTQDCLNWDKPHPTTNYAVGTRAGFGYCHLVITGRKPCQIPGWAHCYGVRASITFHVEGEEPKQINCWIPLSGPCADIPSL